MGVSQKAEALRKSSGGDVEVSAYERNGHPVSAYTRRPS